MARPAHGWACARCTFFNAGDAEAEAAAATAGADAPPRQVTCQVCELRQPHPPHVEPGCTHEFDEASLTSLLQLDEATLSRYRRFVAMRSDERFRECPNCNAPHTEGPHDASNVLTCGTCRHKFCYVHGDAHPGQTCEQFARRRRREEAATERAIGGTTRRCPNRECGLPIAKAGGCNHMTCSRCRTHFCWICGRSFPDRGVSWHYSAANPVGCPGMMMVDVPAWRLRGEGAPRGEAVRECPRLCRACPPQCCPQQQCCPAAAAGCPRVCTAGWTATQVAFRTGSLCLFLLILGGGVLMLSLPIAWFTLYGMWGASGCNPDYPSWWLLGAGTVALIMCCCQGGRLIMQSCLLRTQEERANDEGDNACLCCFLCFAVLGIIFLGIGISLDVPAIPLAATLNPVAPLSENATTTAAVLNSTGGSTELDAGLTDPLQEACDGQLIAHRSLAIAMLVVLVAAVILPALFMIVALFLCLRCLSDFCNSLPGQGGGRR